MNKSNVFFGVDPGSNLCGFGAIQVQNNTVRWLDSGVISTRGAKCLAQKLECIYDGLVEKIYRYSPGCVCVEEAFYAKNVHTTLVLGHARGAVLLAAQKTGARILEYSPREIKKTVVGNGNATKDQVGYMIKMLLSPPPDRQQVDACDALAAALCGYYTHRTAHVFAARI
ncbi:MAG: crossover junction endodeoxyribonuclease RuvC [Chitinivibrionales bacterium]